MTLDWGRAVSLIERAGAGDGLVTLACHVSPDGDALGSMLGVALGLRERGIRCVASFGEPFTVPASLTFLPGQELLAEPSTLPHAPDVMIVFDAAGVGRLGSLAATAERAAELIVLDHHASNTGFGTVHLVDPDAAATAVLAEELLRRLRAPLTKDIALGLYAGLASDTGSFRYPTTTPEVHRLAGRLIAAGVQPDPVGRELWDRAPFGYLQVLAGALARARLADGVIWTTVPKAERDAHDLSYDQLEGVIDVIRRCDEAEVAVVFKETDDGAWYVSTRSKGAVDVSQACVALGGGGHRRAAAFTAIDDPETTIDRLLTLLAPPVIEAAS
jgi:phosphoesterase RecJ-like protein